MCSGCIQSGLECAAAGSVVLAAGLRHASLRVRDLVRPADAAERGARREAQAAAFLEGLGLDPRRALGWDVPMVPVEASSDEELQPT